ncbi:MAG TPA: transcriptional repressor LexA [Geobacteraceae bacterium]|nr:transcriptional repressor LexA [Geobacteraceae bacterium]
MKPEQRESIIAFHDEHGRMPSYAELARIAGLHSKSSAFHLAGKLVREGWLKRDPQGKLLPGPRTTGVKLLGSIAAGFPSPAEEELSDVITLDELLIKNREATFLLKVTGDSMRDEGIRHGDLVLVERTTDVRPGNIVVANIDGEWTIKYFRRRGKQVYLEPANRAYKTIVPQAELKIDLVVRAVIRQYRP